MSALAKAVGGALCGNVAGSVWRSPIQPI